MMSRPSWLDGDAMRWAIGATFALVFGLSLWSFQPAPVQAKLHSGTTFYFNHTIHVKNGVECLTCHAQAAEAKNSDIVMLPDSTICQGCHDGATAPKFGGDTLHPEKVMIPTRQIDFPHWRHVTKMGLKCERCHGDVAEKVTLDGGNFPRMKVCTECHNGVKAPFDCALCHRDPKIKQQVHPPKWIRTHAEVASLELANCNMCHQQQSYCEDCHKGANLRGRPHPANFRMTHAVVARGKQMMCASCHDLANDEKCVTCHRQDSNIMPASHRDPLWRISQHGHAAARDPENCASCHNDQTGSGTNRCISCHQDRDGRRGTQPTFHVDPPFDHGEFHSDRGATCFQCHLDTHRAGTGFCGYCHGEKDGGGGGEKRVGGKTR